MKAYTRDDEIADDVMGWIETIDEVIVDYPGHGHEEFYGNIVAHLTQMHALRDLDIYDCIMVKHLMADGGGDDDAWLDDFREMHA